MTDGPGTPARPPAPTAVRVLVPAAMTAVAAALGYAFAVYPVWYHVAEVRKTETLGGLISVADARPPFVRAYPDDSGVEAKDFDRIAWAVRTVMTPFVGYAPSPGQSHNASITPHQFRGAREPAMPKPPGMTRVFLTGASVAFSAGASSDERTIGGYMQSLLDRRGRRYEVFTFASPAWSSTHERIAIENRLSELEPDLVVELTGVGDALYGERGHNVLWARALTDQYYWDLVNIALGRAGFRTMVDVEDRAAGPVPPELVATRLAKNVRLSAEALAPGKAHLHVFLQPSIIAGTKALSPREQGLRDSKSGYFADPAYYQRCFERIDAIFRAAGTLPANGAYTNLIGLFDATPATEDIYLDSVHFGDRGNLRIAQAIVDTIE